MKKILLFVMLLISASVVLANGPQHRHNQQRHHHHGHRNHWVAPLIIGGTIGYLATRPYYAPPVVYVDPVLQYVEPQPVCTRYIYQNQYGETLREELRCN